MTEVWSKPLASIRPANAEELANIVEEVGAEMLRRALRYPSEGGGCQLGDLDLSEHLAKCRDHEIVIIASTGVAEGDKAQHVCGICGFALNESHECPRWRLQVEETAKGLSCRANWESLFREIDEVVEETWKEDN